MYTIGTTLLTVQKTNSRFQGVFFGVLLLWFFIIHECLAIPDVSFEKISSENRLTVGKINVILKDDRGFMWFGSSRFLYRFDGYDFKDMTPTAVNKDLNNYLAILSLIEDSNGVLWVGTNSGLNRYNKLSESFQRFQYHSEDSNSLSNDFVSVVFEDSNGSIWVGSKGGLDRLNRDAGNFEHIKINLDDVNGEEYWVTAVFEGKNGGFWVGTDSRGMFSLDRATGEIDRFLLEPDNPGSNNNSVVSIDEGTEGTLLITTSTGAVTNFDTASEKFIEDDNNNEYSQALTNRVINTVFNDSRNRTWFGANEGLLRYEPESDEFNWWQYDPSDRRSIGQGNVLSIYEDGDGVIWIGTSQGFISRVVENTNPFQVLQHNPNKINSLSDNDIWAVNEDRDGVVWIGTSKGLNKFDPVSKDITRYLHDEKLSNSLIANDVSVIHSDSSGAIWIGTQRNGLDKFDPKSGRFTHFIHNPDDKQSLPGNSISAIYEDSTGTLWIGFGGVPGLSRFEPSTQTFVHFQHDTAIPEILAYRQVQAIFEDSTNTLWLGTLGGGLYKMDRESGSFSAYTHDPENSNSIGHNNVWVIHEDQEGMLWLGTESGLNRFDRQTEKFSNFNTLNIPSWYDPISGLLEDEKGFLWLGTSKGLSRFNPKDYTVVNFDEEDGLLAGWIRNRAAAKSKAGQMYFGGPNGLNVFDPSLVQHNGTPPPIVISELNVNQRLVTIGPNSILKHAISESKSIELSHQDRIISFEFSALNFISPEKNQFKFRLEGLESEWIHADSSKRLASYMNLTPGTYTFRVTGSNNLGIWNNEGSSLTVIVNSPWWETAWFRFSAVFFIIGVVIAVMRFRERASIAHRIELERLVSERTESLRKFKFALESIDLPIIIINRKYEVEEINENLAISVSRSRDELIGTPIAEVWGEELFDGYLKNAIDKSLEGGQTTIEGWTRISREVKRYHEVTLYPYYADHGEITHAVSIRRDRTEEKLSEDALAEAKEQAEQANNAKTAFLSSMSHEIRTPMNAIIGFTDLIMEDKKISGSVRERIEIINHSGKTLLELINNILEISKIEAGKTELHPTHFNVRDLLENAIQLFDLQIKHKGVNLSLEIDDAVPKCLFADQQKIRHICINLLSNAFKFTEQGFVHLHLRIKERLGDDYFLELFVKDTGYGIDDNEINKLFHKFSQTTSGVQSSGTGLGLTISRSFARLMEGDIRVESKVHEGSCFYVTWLAGKGDEQQIKTVSQKLKVKGLAFGQPSKRILVVDDIYVNRLLLTTLLKRAGFETIEAENGKEALEVYLNSKPDLIFMDMIMPVMSGSMAISELRKREAINQSRTPIVTISASALEEDRQRVMAMDVDGFIRKPFHAEEIYNIIGQLLGVTYDYAGQEYLTLDEQL